MGRTSSDLRVLERLLPAENGITVFDAETQETSYGIWFLDGLPFIFDTHRKDGGYVATLELLTEVVTPIRITAARIRRFAANCRGLGLLPIPYTGCFFKENLHVYSFSGPVRGFDISTAGRSVQSVERTLSARVRSLWPEIPPELLRAQRELLDGTRTARHAADVEVLVRRARESRAQESD